MRPVALVESRWVLRIIGVLAGGPRRFSDLRRELGSISGPVLLQKLRLLERELVIQRRALDPKLRITIYELTDWGRACEPVIEAIEAWGRRDPRVRGQGRRSS